MVEARETESKSEYMGKRAVHWGGEAIHVSSQTMRIMLNLGDLFYVVSVCVRGK